MMIYLKLVLTAVFWGGTFVAAKFVVREVGPYAAAFLRFAMASVVLLAVTLKAEGKLARPGWRQFAGVVILGATGIAFYNVVYFKGLELIEAGRASLIIATIPVFLCASSAVVFKERLTGLKIAGILVSVLGAGVVISRGDIAGLANSGIGWGEVFIFGCVASWVVYSLVGKKVMAGLSPLVSVLYASAVGAVMLAPPALANGMAKEMWGYSVTAWASVAYLALFGTVIGFVWYYEGVKTIGPTRAGLFINFVPISAVTCAFFILGESMTWSLFFGGLLVMSGVYLVNRPQRRTAEAEKTENHSNESSGRAS